ncbi:MAG: hypothetical protein RMK73_10380 [Geminicoccaceae bacterium]|nr:hypothetical protein [Geminicoccaceae bacterium]MDW8341876.1 hypothetical protein [Geminicoccaceae bacterium]
MPIDDAAIVRADPAAVRGAVDAARVAFARAAVSPVRGLEPPLPGSVWPAAPGRRRSMETARELFSGLPVEGGVFRSLTELDHERPPADALDFVCRVRCPLVHAGDDAKMMENLEALSWQCHTTRSFAGPFAQLLAVRRAGGTFPTVVDPTPEERAERPEGEGLNRPALRGPDEASFATAAFDPDVSVRAPIERAGREPLHGPCAIVFGEAESGR